MVPVRLRKRLRRQVIVFCSILKVDFGDEKAELVFGIAGIGDEHLELLSKICEVLEDEEVLEKMKTTSDLDWIMEKLS